MIDEKFLDEQKDKLEKKKEELETSLKSFAQKDETLKDNWKTKFPDFGGESSGHSDMEENEDEVEEYENLLPVEYAMELNLKDVNAALEKIKSGKYGVCENCKKEIEKERLVAVPEAKLCLKCSK